MLWEALDERETALARMADQLQEKTNLSIWKTMAEKDKEIKGLTAELERMGKRWEWRDGQGNTAALPPPKANAGSASLDVSDATADAQAEGSRPGPATAEVPDRGDQPSNLDLLQQLETVEGVPRSRAASSVTTRRMSWRAAAAA